MTGSAPTVPEAWLRGPVPGVAAWLQPAAHALQQVREDVEAAVAGLSDDEVWARPANVAAIGFHMLHLAGSTDRLLTYSRGEALTQAQQEALALERRVYDERPDLAFLRQNLDTVLDAAMEHFRDLPVDVLLEPREVGRKKLPSTRLGAIFHAAEHAARHAGQVVTLAAIVRAR